MPSPEDLHKSGMELLALQTRELDALISDVAGEQHSELPSTSGIVAMMLQALGVSIHSVAKLTQEPDLAVRDCFGIARSAAETAVNIAFIAVGGDALADRAVRHMRQKRWRDLKRSTTLQGRTVSIEAQIGASASDFPGLEDALAEYTNKKGAEVRDWTPENIEQRIAEVGKRSSQAAALLTSSIFTIYRPSSELLHGTYYAVSYFWQGSRPSPVTTREAFNQLWLTEHFVTLFSTLMFAAGGAIHAVATVNNLSEFEQRQLKVLGLMQAWAEEVSNLCSPDSSTGKPA